MPKRKLPIGIQTFRKVRETDCYYVDKTAYIDRLIHEGTHYFLARPRRFGKSLFLDTLKELFEGSEALFRGLAIHARWDWSVRYPVLRLDFSGGDYLDPDGLRRNLAEQLNAVERRVQVTASGAGPERFGFLLEAMHHEAGRRVVVLIDEYDKPILDALGAPETARANRDYLRSVYSNIKFADAHIRFTLLTGVSKFSKVNLFSGLNNLNDITLDRRYSGVCGYTEADLDTVFRAGARRSGPRPYPRVVQRLWLAGRREGVQPLRHSPALRPSQVRRVLVRDRHTVLPHRDVVQPGGRLSGPRRDDRHE